MFHQIKVPPGTSKPWDSYGSAFKSLNNPHDEYQTLVHIFGAVSSSCYGNRSARETEDDNEERFGQEVINTVRRNVYVDDGLLSTKRMRSTLLSSWSS